MIALNGGSDRINHAQGQLRGVVFQHNTGVSAASTPCWTSLYFSAGAQKLPLTNLTANIWILDNVLCCQPTGDFRQQGTAGLSQYMGASGAPSSDLNKRFFGNVMYVPTGDGVQPFPPHNLSTTKAFVFVDPAKGNFELLLPKWNETSDGKRVGIDFSTLPQQP